MEKAEAKNPFAVWYTNVDDPRAALVLYVARVSVVYGPLL